MSGRWYRLRRWIDASDLRDSLHYSWLILSVPMLAAVLLPLAAPVGWIQAMAPHCVWKALLGHECPGCGLTTGLLQIAHCQGRAAEGSNAAAIPLYAAFAGNSLWWLRSVARSIGLIRFQQEGGVL